MTTGIKRRQEWHLQFYGQFVIAVIVTTFVRRSVQDLHLVKYAKTVCICVWYPSSESWFSKRSKDLKCKTLTAMVKQLVDCRRLLSPLDLNLNARFM